MRGSSKSNIRLAPNPIKNRIPPTPDRERPDFLASKILSIVPVFNGSVFHTEAQRAQRTANGENFVTTTTTANGKRRTEAAEKQRTAKKLLSSSVSRRSSRARDFFDIHTILENFTIDLDASENYELLGNIFAAKKVPLRLLGRIAAYREFHREDFLSVRDTVKSNVELEDFDFYFDYVVSVIESLPNVQS
jgi:hypothetical protein